VSAVSDRPDFVELVCWHGDPPFRVVVRSGTWSTLRKSSVLVVRPRG